MKPEDKSRRLKQLIDEIGWPLVEQARAEIGAHEASRDVEVEGKWVAILEKLDETLDPAVLLPLLNVPDEVRRHFKDALEKRLMLCHRPGRPAIPSYLPMSLTAARKRLAATFIRYFKYHGVPKDKAVELTTLMFDDLPQNLRNVGSAVRNLRLRRTKARGAAE